MSVQSAGKISVYRSLQASAAAGLSAPQAVEILFESCAPESLLSEFTLFWLLDACAGHQTPPLKVSLPTLHALAAKLRDGIPFSDALACHPDEFKPWEIAILKIGERTGRMDEVFGDLAEILDGRRTALLNLAARSARPLLIESLIPWIVCAPLAYFAGFLVYLCVALAGFLAITPTGKILLSRKSLPELNPNSMPGFSKFLFCRCLAGLIKAGVGPDEAICEAAKAAGRSSQGQSDLGEPVHVLLRRYGLFSSEELACLRISEECGKLDDGLTALAAQAHRAWSESNRRAGAWGILADGL